MKVNRPYIGVGATKELSLRVSVATLVSVLFDSPEDGRMMLALERTATLREINGRAEVSVRSKPFGGGVRIANPNALTGLIGHFNYDSEQSRRERDFRIQISQIYWEKIKEICREDLKETENSIFDSSPERELAEEFKDTLHIKITKDQYHLKPRGIHIEDVAVKTDNVRAAGRHTVRIYYLFEARIMASDIINEMLSNSRRYSDEDLRKIAFNDARQGGKGRANTILTLRLDDLKNVYHSIPKDRRSGPVQVGGHQLSENVPAIIV